MHDNKNLKRAPRRYSHRQDNIKKDLQGVGCEGTGFISWQALVNGKKKIRTL
jgi:hypothetical protein